MEDVKIIESIKEFLISCNQFALATYGDYPWIATMFYGVDDDLNMYFLTDPNTIHAQALYKNPLVAAVIADSPQDPLSKKKGIQLHGKAFELTDDNELDKGFSILRSALNVTDPKYGVKGIKSGELKYRLYKLVPNKIKYYNEELWEEDDAKVINL